MAFTTDIPRRTMNYVDSTNNVSFQVTSPEYILREQEIAGDNNSSSSEENIAFFKVEQLTFLWILFVLIVISNCLVLRVVLPARMRGSSRMNFFVMHLAIADLSNGLMCVLPDIIWRTTVNWYAGNFMCKTVKFFQEVVVFASTYVLVSLSLDRLDAIARPLRFTGSGTRARILVASAWIFSVIFSIPSLVLFEDTPSPNDESIRFCYLDLSEKWHWMLYVTLLAVSLFIIPAVIIIVCYTTIVYVIWKNSHLLMPSPDGSTKGSKRNKSKNYIRPTGSCAEAASTKSHSSATSSRGVIPKAKIKTIKMTFLIVLAFILCWSPFMIFSLLQVYGMIPNTHTMGAVATFFQSLAPLNSVANPVIYGIFNTRSCRNAKTWAFMALHFPRSLVALNKFRTLANSSRPRSAIHLLKHAKRINSFNQMANPICCCSSSSRKNSTFGVSMGSEYTGVSEMDVSVRTGSNAMGPRRISGLPYVRSTVTETERQILMRNLTPAGSKRIQKKHRQA